jgi:hypothetical protein
MDHTCSAKRIDIMYFVVLRGGEYKVFGTFDVVLKEERGAKGTNVER